MKCTILNNIKHTLQVKTPQSDPFVCFKTFYSKHTVHYMQQHLHLANLTLKLKCFNEPIIFGF